MASRTVQLLNSFNAGELSPLLLARTDFNKYQNGCEILENWLPLPQGGAEQTPGTWYVGQTRNGDTDTAVLIPFIFGIDTAYMLEFTDQVFRIFRSDRTRVESGGLPIEIATGIGHTEVDFIKYAQDADRLYLVHPRHWPKVITRTSDTQWTCEDYEPKDGPFLDENIDRSIYINENTSGTNEGELVANGTFAGNDTGWTKTPAGTGAATYNGGTGREDLVHGAGANDYGQIVQAFPLIPGKTYTLTLDVFTNNVQVRYGIDPINGGTTVATVTPGAGKTASITGQDGTTYIALRSLTVASTASVDNVTMKVNRHEGAICNLLANTALWQPGHVGAYWKLSDKSGLPSEAAWIQGTVYSLGNRVVNEGNVYECVINGTAGNKPPVHELGVASDGGAQWAFINKGWGYIKITSYTDSTHVQGIVKLHLPANANLSTVYWSEGAWSDVQGFPRGITFDQQRLGFCGSDGSPPTIWESELGIPDGMRAGEIDDDATIFDVQSNQVNALLWMVRGRLLFAGTNGGEYSLRGGNDSVVTPTNPPVVEELGAYGSADIQPVKVGQNVLFVQRGRKVIREIVFNATAQSVLGPKDVTILAEHITGTGVKRMAYQQAPNPTIWCVRDDGVMATLTYFPDEEVKAWARQVTDGTFHSVAVIPTPDGVDQVWVVIRRTMATGTHRYIEVYDRRLVTHSTVSIAYPPTVPITNAAHLQGKSVELHADGEVQSTQFVQNDGTVTPTATCTEMLIGLPVRPTLLTVRPEVKLQDGSAQGRLKRWAKIRARVHATRKLEVNGTVLTQKKNKRGQYDGDLAVTNLGYDPDGRIQIRAVDTQRAVILGLFGVLDTGDA